MFRFGRKILFTGILGSAVSAPYLATHADQAKQSATSTWNNLFAAAPAGLGGPNPYSLGATQAPKVEGAPAGHTTAHLSSTTTSPTTPTGALPVGVDPLPGTPSLADMPLEGFAVHDLSEVLRFDISPDWVYQRWARKSTSLSDLDLFGIRVPLVTGMGVDDLAGSLTYYFSAGGQLEKIRFRGRTGDPRKVISIVMSRFGLMRQAPKLPGELLYEVRWNAQAMSRLRVAPASVIWASVPYATYSVDLELNRPGAARYIQEPPVAPGPIPTHAPLQSPRAPH